MNIAMIRAAALQSLEGQVRRTPLLNSSFVDEIAGRRVWMKAEALQHTGSFKFRGGWSAVSALSPARAQNSGRDCLFIGQPRARRGAGRAAAWGIPAVIVMPTRCAASRRVENTRALRGGGEFCMTETREDREAIGRGPGRGAWLEL